MVRNLPAVKAFDHSEVSTLHKKWQGAPGPAIRHTIPGGQFLHRCNRSGLEATIFLEAICPEACAPPCWQKPPRYQLLS